MHAETVSPKVMGKIENENSFYSGKIFREIIFHRKYFMSHCCLTVERYTVKTKYTCITHNESEM